MSGRPASNHSVPWSFHLRVEPPWLPSGEIGLGSVRSFIWICLVIPAALAGCSNATEGPLSFGGYGNTLVVQDTPPYFVVDVCAEGEAASVTFEDVEGVHVSGATKPINFRVAWPDGPPFERVISSHDPVPAAYEPVEGASGTIGECGGDPHEYGALAVVFPPALRKSVSVQDLRITYEVAGRSHSQTVGVSLTQCVKGTRPATRKDGCVPERSTR